MIRKVTLLVICAILSLGAAWGAQSSRPYTLHYEVRVKSANFGNMGTRRLWIKGDSLRWESDSADLKLKLVKNKQGVFLLHPWNKIAAKYPANSPRGNPRTLMPGPAGSVKSFLSSVKAVKKGQETVDKEKCDVYAYSDSTLKCDCKLWVSAKSGKPVKLIMQGQQGQKDVITATYTKYQESLDVADSMFELPKGYTIRAMPEPKAASTGKTPAKTDNKKSG